MFVRSRFSLKRNEVSVFTTHDFRVEWTTVRVPCPILLCVGRDLLRPDQGGRGGRLGENQMEARREGGGLLEGPKGKGGPIVLCTTGHSSTISVLVPPSPESSFSAGLKSLGVRGSVCVRETLSSAGSVCVRDPTVLPSCTRRRWVEGLEGTRGVGKGTPGVKGHQ